MTNETQKPKSTVIFEPERDEFHRYPTTPQLQQNAAMAQTPSSPLVNKLEDELRNVSEKEEYFDRLRLFKKRQHKDIQALEAEPLENRRAILRQITDVAEAIIKVSYDAIQRALSAEIGHPTYLSSYKQICPSSLAVIGMGKLGGREMNYESDLDLVFVFSHLGETTGRKKITNAEYFSKFVQRFINLISVLTSAGRCYEIDVELRPSGNAGPLVISFDHFLEHQSNQAMEWERLALQRARPILIPSGFGLPLAEHLDQLAHARPLPENFFKTMHEIRDRVLKEKARENARRFDIKIGQGGLMDVEFILQGLQLKNQRVFPELRQRGLFEVLDALQNHDFLAAADLKTLSEAHLLYRTLESQLHLIKKRPEHAIAFDADEMTDIARKTGHASAAELERHLASLRGEVRKIYGRIYELT